jgi:hypothetical protein
MKRKKNKHKKNYKDKEIILKKKKKWNLGKDKEDRDAKR